ncbi:MAG: SDR family oxidoreductase [Chitinophagaceae bacterium]|nr:MAG: SDR family oxidoreductase [Chitinophagaceae bacterium]
MHISLTGTTAVICGSTQGIGKAIAEAFAAAGANCILVARNKKSLDDVIGLLSVNEEQKHHAVVADFSETEQVKSAISQILAIGDVHILVNNTGGPKPGPIIDVDPNDFVKAFEQHIVCNQLLTQAFLPAMKKLQYGRIINIISTSVRIPLANLGASNTIRAAVASWAKTLSNEVGSFNVTVNNILPGLTETTRLSSLIDNMVEKTGLAKEQVKENLKKEIPMRRFGEPAELAALATFLASPAASYITGTSIPVDGGRTGTV